MAKKTVKLSKTEKSALKLELAKTHLVGFAVTKGQLSREAKISAIGEHIAHRQALLAQRERVHDWTPHRALIAHELGLDMDSKESKGIDALRSSIERLIFKIEASVQLADKLLKLEFDDKTTVETLASVSKSDQRSLLEDTECRREVMDALRLLSLKPYAVQWLDFVKHHIDMRDKRATESKPTTKRETKKDTV